MTIVPLVPLVLAAWTLGGVGEAAAGIDWLRAAIEAAPDGSTLRVPAGEYRGQVVVRKPIVLDGGGVAVIDGGGVGTVIEILVPGVTVRGFVVRGSGDNVDGEPAGIRAETGPVVVEDNVLEDVLFGIDLRSAPESTVRRNTVVGKPFEMGRRGDAIRLWWSSSSTVEDNVVRGARDAVFWYCEDLVVRRNRVSDSRYGLHFMYSHSTTVVENVLEDNSVGAYLMYSNGLVLERNVFARNRGTSGYGLGLKDCDDLRCADNAILANRVGAYADRAPFSIGSVAEFRGNLVAYNGIGVAMTPQTQGGLLVGNAFVENEEQVAVLGRGSLEGNTFTESGRGNYWSDYAGFDLDDDGLGDVPYRSESLFESLLAREPLLRLLVHGPAQQAVEFTARALPAVRPEPRFVDPFPLMTMPVVEVAGAAADPPDRVVLAIAAAGLLLAAGACLAPALSRQGLPRRRPS